MIELLDSHIITGTPEVLMRHTSVPFQRWVAQKEREMHHGLSDATRAARVVRAMQGPWYQDIMPPHLATDVASVTLAATDKALYPATAYPQLGSAWFNQWVGKLLKIWMVGRITTAATPGNGQWDIYWGTGADANGTVLAAGAAMALVANQTSITWASELVVRTRAQGATGTLICGGFSTCSVFGATNTQIPANTMAAVTVDLTGASIVSVQFKRSGSTAETMQIHDIQFIAAN